MLFSPLEQFEVIPLFLRESMPFFLDSSWNNFSFFLAYSLLWFIIIVFFSLSRLFVVPSKAQLFFEEVYEFLYLLFYQQAGIVVNMVFPLFSTVFLLILLSNFFGLVPFSFTLTSSFLMTFTLAVFFNFAFFLYGCKIHGLKFLSLFVPKGVPKVLLPLLIVVEVLSYMIRSFSLSLRLFANMMAGHCLLFILSGFVKVALLFGVFSFLAVIPFFLVLFVYFLEVGIAFLQAYVFVVLLSIYFNEALHLH